MIQLNLLPDVKLKYIKAQRLKRFVLSVSVIVTAASVGILVVLLIYDGFAKNHANNLSSSVNQQVNQLKSTPNLNNYLTIQSQLGVLNSLHDNEPAAGRLFNYLEELTPTVVNISEFTCNFNLDTASISGTADSLSSINTFIDTLKLTSYTIQGSKTATTAFSSVLLQSFAPPTSQQPANFNITFGFDPNLFNQTEKVNLVIPSIVTSRLEITNPTNLFGSSGSKLPIKIDLNKISGAK